MNNTYRIRVEAPLLRPGLSIETTVSRRYAKAAADELMSLVRKINEAASVPTDLQKQESLR